jgi:hypothetical protein
MITIHHIKIKNWNSFQEFYNKGLFYGVLATPVISKNEEVVYYKKEFKFRYNKKRRYELRISDEDYINFIKYTGFYQI